MIKPAAFGSRPPRDYAGIKQGLPALQCGDCTLCCRGKHELITIQPERGDVHKRYKTDVQADGRRTLKRDSGGRCIYLGREGCTIHSRKPIMCRQYDCRAHYLLIVRQGINLERLNMPSVRRGRELLGSHA